MNVAEVGNGGGVVERLLTPLGNGERRLHFFQILDVELVAGELEAVFIGERGFGLNRQQRLVGGGVGLFDVVPVVGRHHADAEFLRPGLQNGVVLLLLGQAVVLNLDEVVVSEQLAVPQQPRPRVVLAPLHQQLLHFGAQAAGKGDDAFVVLLKQLVVDARLVVVALGVAAAAQAAEVLVALEVAGEQRQVKDALFPVLSAAAVSPGAEAGHHIRLVADDRLDPHPRRVVIEMHRPVHVAVVGHGERRGLPLGRHFLGPLQQVLELGRAVEQAVLRVLVQVGKFFRLAAGAVRQVDMRVRLDDGGVGGCHRNRIGRGRNSVCEGKS